MKEELFVVVKTEQGYNITLPNSDVMYFSYDRKTLKELFKNMSKLTNN